MWIIATLAGLAVLIILALSVPLNLRFHIDIPGKPRFRTRISWLFGLVHKEIVKKEEPPSNKNKTSKSKRKPGDKVIGVRVLLQIIRVKGLLKQVKNLLQDNLRHVKLRVFEADFRVGLGDPADTGLLFAFIGPAACFLNLYLSNKVNVQASFAEEAVVEGSADTELRLIPWLVIIPVLRFIISPPGFRVTKILVAAKWKKRK